MKKLLFLFTILVFFSSNIQAKSNTEITGKVKDNKGEVISFANVILYAAQDSSMVKVEFTDESGKFLINNVKTGDYWLQVTFVGMQEYNTPVFALAEGQSKDFGIIEMSIPDNELEEVTVVAKRPILEIKPDKMVFNVDGSINASGNSGMELLRKSPGVVVDNNDNILLTGKSGVVVYINSKPSPLSGSDLTAYLNSMQSEEIDAIEIITNPNSKFDAEGNAGIINIRLKKDKKLGGNGNINLGFAQGITIRFNGSINGNYRTKNMNVFARYGIGKYENQNYMNLYREQPAGTFDQRNINESNSNSQNFKAGADFYIGEKSIIGLIADGYVSNWSTQGKSTTVIAPERNAAIDSVLVAETIGENKNVNYNFNLNYRFDNKKGLVWNMDADYGLYRNSEAQTIPNKYLDATQEVVLQEIIFRTEAPKDIDIRTFKVDHENTFGETSFGAGAKYANVITNNTFDFYDVINNQDILKVERSNNFKYTENVTAVYANTSRKFKKVGVSVGLRGEHTQSLGDLIAMQAANNEQVDTSYFNVFPSAGITYQLNQKNSFQLNYSRRIKRPNYENLNPFIANIDQLVYSQGNPFLRPEYANNIQLSHTYNYFLNTSLSYSRTTGLITRITDIGEDEKSSYITWRNLAEQDNISLSISAPLPIKEWWSSFTSINAFYQHNKADYGEGRIVDVKAKTLQVYGQHTFKLPADISFEVSGWWLSPSIWEGTFKTESMYSIDAGVQKKLFKGKGKLKVSVSDIFKSNAWFAESQIGALYQKGNGGWDSRRVRVNFSYSFGNENVKSRKRKTGLEDESGRVKSSN